MSVGRSVFLHKIGYDCIQLGNDRELPQMQSRKGGHDMWTYIPYLLAFILPSWQTFALPADEGQIGNLLTHFRRQSEGPKP